MREPREVLACVDVDSSEIALDPRPASVGRARHWLSRQLDEWGIEHLDYDASMVVSELVTNAVLHARTELVVRLQLGTTLRVEVCDSSQVMPSPRTHGSAATTGRGLHLVAALATSWGCDRTPTGKVVWAEFADVGGAKDVTEEPGVLEARRPVVAEAPPAAEAELPRLRRIA